MNQQPAKLNPTAQDRAVVPALLSGWLPVLAFASAALIFTVMLVNLLFPNAAFADSGFPLSESDTRAVVSVDDATSGEVTYESDLPYNRDTAGAFADQRNTLAQTATHSPVRAGSAIGLAALAVAALAWAAMLLNQAKKDPLPL